MNAILVTGLALFLLGLIGISYLSFKQEETRLKNVFRISAFLNDDAKTGDVELLQRNWSLNPMVKSTEFISKERAAEIVREKWKKTFQTFWENTIRCPHRSRSICRPIW